jgi:hypothetical protein
MCSSMGGAFGRCMCSTSSRVNASPLRWSPSLPGKRVVRLLAQLVLWHGAPKRNTLDNGPEFTGQALDAWAYKQSVA